MNNTDSEKLRGVADWMNVVNIAAFEWQDIEEAVTPTDLRRIASDLEKREAPSELPEGLDDDSNCDHNFKLGWIACEKKLQSERDYWRIRAGSAEDYIEALWGFIEDPSETNRIHAEVRRSEWMSYVESPEGIKMKHDES